jgi:hypothetical protein
MIKRFKDFINEEVSGTELVGYMGPAYGEQDIPNTINKFHNSVLHSKITDKIYSLDEYDDLYNEYLIKGGKPLHGYNNENLDLILYLIQ